VKQLGWNDRRQRWNRNSQEYDLNHLGVVVVVVAGKKDNSLVSSVVLFALSFLCFKEASCEEFPVGKN